MAVNNILLHELVDRAVPPGGTVNYEALHKLLHVIVANLDSSSPPKTDFRCTVGAKTSGGVDQKVENVSEKVNELKNMVEMQRKLISELHLKVLSLERTSPTRGRSRSPPATGRRSSSATSRSLIVPSSGDWTIIQHPGKVPTAGKSKQAQRSTMSVRSMHSASKGTITVPRCVKCQQEIMGITLMPSQEPFRSAKSKKK